MKKIKVFTFLLSFLLVIVGCGCSKPTQLGTSDYSIVLPTGYASVEDDFGEDQVAYFYKDDASIDVLKTTLNNFFIFIFHSSCYFFTL